MLFLAARAFPFLLVVRALPFLLIGLSFYSVVRVWVMFWTSWSKRLDQMRRYEVGFGKPPEKTQRAMQSGEFHRIEEEFTGLGFELLGDYVIAGGTQDNVPAFDAPLAAPSGDSVKQEFKYAHASVCRVLVHRNDSCIASITSPLSTLPRDDNPYLGTLIASLGEGWTYTTHADLPPPLLEMESSSRDLSSFEGQIPVDQLLEFHLARRAEIARAGGFAWGAPPSIEQLTEWETQRYARIREWASRRSPWSLRRAEQRGRRKLQREWLGELRGQL